MHIHRQSRRLPLGLFVCGVMVGAAVSTLSGCSKSKTPAATGPVVPDSGVIAGTVSSSQGGALVVDVTATDANNDGFTVNTDSSGNYLIPNVPAGSGKITVSLLPGNCTTPAAGAYTVGRGDTTTVLIEVACTP